MGWMSKLFGGKAKSPIKEEDKEHALVLAVRHKLLPYRKGLSGAEELFVPMDQFLTALEMRAAGSPTMRLISSPQTVRASARIALQFDVMKGNMPFFYKDDGNKTVFIGDVRVRARDLAEHAATLIDRSQVTLAGVYAQALDDLEDDMETYAALNVSSGLSYNDGKNMAKVFETGADEDENHIIQPVLRFRNEGIRPS